MRRKNCWNGWGVTKPGGAVEYMAAPDQPGKLSIIVPVLNEAAQIAHILAALAPLRTRGAELIVVDGGSQDATISLAQEWADQVLSSPRGRAVQMHCGALAASSPVLLFLHADTLLPPEADRLILQGLAQSKRQWGRFDVQVIGQPRMLRAVSAMINWRSRTFGIATGDQAIFITHKLYQEVGGFPQQALMEDIEVCKRLKRLHHAPLCLREKVQTSGRRWEKHGVWRTIFLMWRLRFYYWIGVSADTIAKAYR